MADQSLTDSPDAFVIRRLRAKPVEYTVKIRHFVSGGEWMMSVSVHDITTLDAVQRSRVTADLRQAAELLQNDGWLDLSQPPTGFFLTDAGPYGWTTIEPATGMSWSNITQQAALDRAWSIWESRQEENEGG